VYAQADASVTVEVLVDTESLTIFIPITPANTGTLVSLDGFGFEVGALTNRTRHTLQSYFPDVPLAFVTPGTCFRLQATGSIAPTSKTCTADRTFLEPLAQADLFWYNAATNRFRTLSLLRGDRPFDVCPAGLAQCVRVYLASSGEPELSPSSSTATLFPTATLLPTSESSPPGNATPTIDLTQIGIQVAATLTQRAANATPNAPLLSASPTIDLTQVRLQVAATLTQRASGGGLTPNAVLASPTPTLIEQRRAFINTPSRNANVRSAPTTTATSVGTLPNGAQIVVLADETGDPIAGSGNNIWFRIEYAGAEAAYVHSSIVSFAAPARVTTAAVAQPTPGAPGTTTCVGGALTGVAGDFFLRAGRHSQTLTLGAGASLNLTLTVTDAVAPYGVGLQVVDASGADRIPGRFEVTPATPGGSVSTRFTAPTAGSYRIEARGDASQSYSYRASWTCG